MEAPIAKPRRGKRAYLILFVVAMVVATLWVAHHFWSKGKQSTDDAQIEADVVPLAARVGGVIKAAKVSDNQLVKAGDVLFEIDPSDLDVEVARTEAELLAAKAASDAAQTQIAIVSSTSTGGLSSAKAALEGASASVRGAADAVRAAEASVASKKADLATAESELARTTQLVNAQALTKRDLEHAQQVRDVAKAALDNAQAQLDLARSQRGMAESKVAEATGKVTMTGPVDQQLAAVKAQVALAEARVKAAEVARDKAKLQRSYATVVAPMAGVVSRLGAHPGQTIGMGQTLLMLVPTENYVVANFKESQVGKMKVGDPVDIEIDAFPGSTFRGTVNTVSPTTGARFSLIPPDNATGNFVKVVQRVPVKIVWTTRACRCGPAYRPRSSCTWASDRRAGAVRCGVFALPNMPDVQARVVVDRSLAADRSQRVTDHAIAVDVSSVCASKPASVERSGIVNVYAVASPSHAPVISTEMSFTVSS